MIEFFSYLSCCSIVVLAHNRYDCIRNTLENLKTETINSGVEIIIIENGSSVDIKSVINDALVGWGEARLISLRHNVGIAEGRNTGWKLASRDYILFIDDDIVISRAAIEGLIEFALKAPDFGVLSPTILDSSTHFALNGFADDGLEVKKFYEACFLIDKSLLARTGYMDRLLRVAGEGLDFSLRMRKVGLKIIRVFDVVVYHFDRPRSLADNRTRRLAWMWSFARVYWKNFSPLIAFFLTLKTLFSHLRSGVLLYGIKYAFLLTRESFFGSISGLRSRYGVVFYNDYFD